MELYILLSAIIVLSVSSELNQEYNFYTYNPYSVIFDSELVTLSYYRTSNHTHHLVTHSIDSKTTHCRIAVDANKDNINGVIRAVSLKNKIVVWSESNLNINSNNQFLRVSFTFRIVDPLKCTYKSILNIVDEVPSSYPTYRPVVLAHDDDNFDIFFASEQVCSPCRFTGEGEKIELQYQVQQESEDPGFFTKIEYIKQARRYVYVYNFKNRTATVKLLDEDDFNVYPGGQIWLDDFVSELSVISPGPNNSYIGIGYSPPNTAQTDYLLFDVNLSLIFRATLTELDYHSTQEKIIEIDSSGNSYITVVQASSLDRSISFVSLKYDPKGKLIDNYVSEKLKPVPYNVQALLIDKCKYCIIIHEAYDYNDMDRRITKIKCYNI